jgi:rubrerythrin
MQLSSPLTLPRRRTRRAAQRRATAAVSATRERNRRANRSEDAALYSCSCGYVFKAAVTTSVGCPHCGTDQAW